MLQQSPTLKEPERFALAGKARFTIVSKLTGTRFTFRVRKAGDDGRRRFAGQSTWFVAVLTGSDNERDFSYLGFIRDGVYRHGAAKSRIDAGAPSARAFAWFWTHLTTGARDATEFLDVYHEGTCGRCGRALTVPESIQSGFGPECIRFVCG